MTARLGRKLSKLREEHKLSAEYVAGQLGVHAINLKKWERSKALPDNDTLVKLAQIYGVASEELVSIVEMDRAYTESAWSAFPYPTVVFVLYLIYGTFIGDWHPAWVVLLTVPLYRKIGEYMIERKR